jgi:Tol biopolymer transport system component
VGTNFFVKAVSGEDAPRQLPRLQFTRGARRLAFYGEDALVFLRGDVSQKDFWLVDLQTGRERQLTSLGGDFAIGDFDVSPDGRQIIFDRTREESDIVFLQFPDR